MPKVAIDKLRVPNSDTEIPRLRQEAYLVSEYAAAMRLYDGWGDFPEIACDQDYLVLDGVHRVLAAQAAGVAKVDARIIACETPAQRLLVAAELNARHGKRWESKDVARLAILADRYGVEAESLATAMRVRVERIERVPVTTVVRKSLKASEPDREERIYAKRAARWAIQGRTLTEAQEQVVKSLTTPNTADKILSDLIRLHELDALPPLNEDSYRDLLAVQEILSVWATRDQHLLEAA
jgi:ParB-like chromosome segregation protein Spo0J